ncbi:MAG: alpha/beta hydrolase [Alphaproteobacteria bacterium]|nr:alpha/beta hydrolase [Alphaproteobacteria bacterium]
MYRLVCATLSLLLLAGCQQQGVSAHRYGPPEGTSPAYWQVAAYYDKPPIGPEVARGVLFWSHGVSGQNVQWKGKPLRFVKKFADEGWDVIKVNRNNLHERSWNASGPKHVADLQERARKARSDGYRRVVLGGQSYGGAISLEAASIAGIADGVIAIAPGHGSDACGKGYGIGRRADTLPRQLREALERNEAPRTVLMVADGDECVGFNRPHASYRETLQASGSSFVFLDDTMPIRGHFAGNTNQFDRWYGQCIVEFLDAVGAPKRGETACPSPSPVPAYLLPDGYRPPADGGPGSLLGAWSGSYSIGKRGTRNLCLLVEQEHAGSFRAEVAFGAGSQRKASMVTARRYFSIDASGGSFVYERNKYRMTVEADAERKNVSVTIRTEKGKEYRSRLKRGCSLLDDWPLFG